MYYLQVLYLHLMTSIIICNTIWGIDFFPLEGGLWNKNMKFVYVNCITIMIRFERKINCWTIFIFFCTFSPGGVIYPHLLEWIF